MSDAARPGGTPTMKGFRWLLPGAPSSPSSGIDDWCLRNSLCRLFSWPVGSDEWAGFIEGPHPDDAARLEEYLGLIRVDPMIPQHFSWLLRNLEHPGISNYNFPEQSASHCQYEPSIARYRGLPPQYAGVNAELIGFTIDLRQATHVA